MRTQFHHLPSPKMGRWLLRMLISRRCFSSRRPLSVCVVGSGPAGFYTADKVMKAHQAAEVDIIDRLPTPFGLVRSGVAPDHPETKIVVNQFTKVATNERCSFFGNVTLGTNVSLSDLREIYDVVVLAYGAESDRPLGIPGEGLKGILSAREFVWWYNGHPDCKTTIPDFTCTDTAVILGQGNVALDVARILLRPTSELTTTDIAEPALVSLTKSTIRKVYLVGRRGPIQAACTAKELREILGTKSTCIHINEADLYKTSADEDVLKNSRIKKRVYDLLLQAATSHQHSLDSQRELHFMFFRKPDRFMPSDNGENVAGLRLEKTCLKENDKSGKMVAVGTGQFEDLSCGLVLKSIGYKALQVDGLPFDCYRGIVPNARGRVLVDQVGDPKFEPGLYVVGWLKRGATGIIGTNLYCAEETVASISEDIEEGVVTPAPGLPKPGRRGLCQLLDKKNIRFVTFRDWEKIDLEEKARGRFRNKPREKISDLEELLRVVNG